MTRPAKSKYKSLDLLTSVLGRALTNTVRERGISLRAAVLYVMALSEAMKGIYTAKLKTSSGVIRLNRRNTTTNDKASGDHGHTKLPIPREGVPTFGQYYQSIR